MSRQSGQLVIRPGDHAVQFYRGDDELVATVAGYLRAGLAAGDPVLVVATAAHRLAFEAGLAALGTDVTAAKASGQFLAVDAVGTMRGFVTGDGLDPARFEFVIGSLLRRVAVPGRAARIYGEMVAVLWDEGRVNDALELEELWNGLAAREPLSLLCGYEAPVMAHEAATEVCRLHCAVVPAPQAPGRSAERFFPGTRVQARQARHFVAETLSAWSVEEAAGDATIVAAELVANVVVHAGSAFTVTVSQIPGGVRISVRDAVPLPSGAGAVPLPVTEGHGLAVVTKVASRWAAEPVPGGKVVWAELPAR